VDNVYQLLIYAVLNEMRLDGYVLHTSVAMQVMCTSLVAEDMLYEYKQGIQPHKMTTP
jgi:hypothetical protein